MRSGPDVEIERLYRQQGGRLWRALVAYPGDPEVVSDAMAEAFAQALGRGDELREPLRWVWRVAFRTAAGELKHRRGHRPGLPPVIWEIDESVGELVAALRLLSPNQRAAVVLHYAGYPTKDIAQMLGSSAGTVRVHLSQGRKRLGKILEEHGD